MPPLSFEEWKRKLRENCEAQGKLLEFNCLGNYVLQMLWESGLEPSVQSLTGGRQGPILVTRSAPFPHKP